MRKISKQKNSQEKNTLQAVTETRGGKLVAIASTEDRDRVGDILSVTKWDFAKFLLNPVLQAGHDYRPQYTVGIAKNIRVEGKKVLFDPVFHTITPLAKQIKEMYEQGFLKAWSVGFIPASDEKGLNELLEVSAVAVPANAYALMKSFSASDEELESEVKGWMTKELVEDDGDDEEDVEEIEGTSGESGDVEEVNEEDVEEDEDEEVVESEVEDNEIKALVEQSTGETDSHIHLASFDDESGNGTTDVVEGHSHEISAFEVQESDGHTHTLDVEGKMYGKKKPKKKKSIEEIAWNSSLPKCFHKDYEFDIDSIESVRLSFENEIITKFFNCEVKKLFVNTYSVPSPLLGSYLAGFKYALSDYNLIDTRNWSGNVEYPPLSEVIQLNSEKSEDFLVEGMRFYKANDKNGLVVKFSPGWYGMHVTLVTSEDKKEFNKEILEKVHAWVKENNYLKNEKFALSGQFIKKSNITWDDVIGDEKTVGAARKSVEKVMSNPDSKSRGLLFVGPPGTGKTMTGKALLNEVKSTFIWVSSKDMDRVGPVTALKTGFSLARELAPCVLFMEDIDYWIREYSTDLLKTEMDGMQENKGIVTILTSNHPEMLPDALLDRPGRFHEILNYSLPSDEARVKMLVTWAELSEKDAEAISKKIDGYSGAHIKELVEYAQILVEDDGLSMADALEKSLAKLIEQRELIQQIRQTQKGYDTITIKEGKVISKKNLSKIVDARDALNTVIQIADKEEAEEKVLPKKFISDLDVAVKKINNKVENKTKLSEDEILIKTLQSIVKISNKTLHHQKKSRQT